MDALPELRSVFSLGDKVRVHGRSVTLELDETGVEHLDAAALRELGRAW